jgi:ABC-type multidrug transport system permease subunit
VAGIHALHTNALLLRLPPYLAYAVVAARTLIDGRLRDVAVLQAFAIFAVLGALALFWATRSIRKAAM